MKKIISTFLVPFESMISYILGAKWNLTKKCQLLKIRSKLKTFYTLKKQKKNTILMLTMGKFWGLSARYYH